MLDVGWEICKSDWMFSHVIVGTVEVEGSFLVPRSHVW